ncbi:MAG: hypothetical protein J6Q65_01475, partial [Lentisphaeria bacterium]|nr:hypothetical protein [Lentisphaeria bacterium]
LGRLTLFQFSDFSRVDFKSHSKKSVLSGRNTLPDEQKQLCIRIFDDFRIFKRISAGFYEKKAGRPIIVRTWTL